MLLALFLAPFFSFANFYYVNDANLSGDVYSTAIGNDANAGTTSAPFATVNFALSVAVDGDVIYIDAGNYVVNNTIVVNKAVNIYGPNMNLSGYDAGRTTEAVLDFSTNPTSNLSDFYITATTGAVAIKGITLRDDVSTLGSVFNRNGITMQAVSTFNFLIQNNIFERNNTNLNANTKNSLIYAVYIYPSIPITVDNNYFHGLSSSGLFNNSSWRSGIWVNQPNYAVTISNNHFLNMRAGINLYLNPLLNVFGNDINLGTTGTTGISTDGSSAGTAYTLVSNNFSGYGIYIGLVNNFSPAFVMDATTNTFNGKVFSSLSQADGLAVEASLKHANMTGLNGFIKIKPGNVYVTPLANGDNAKFIQKTIDNFAQTGDTVNIGTFDGSLGTFKENLLVNKSVTLLGQGQTTVTISPATSNPNCSGGGTGSLCTGGTAASSVILVQASNVSVKNLTVDGDNTALTSGQVFGGADIDARNGIITDNSTGLIYDNLLVDNVTVKNIFLRGIYASSEGSFTFSNNNVTNVQADAASIGMFNFGGAGAFTNNTVSNTNDAISSNWSKGSTYSGNIVTNSGSGIHTDNNGGLGGIADVIQNNNISNSPTGGLGIFVFAPYVATSIDGNTVTNVETGLANFGQNAIATPIFTRNTVDAQNKANSIGILQTTDQLGFGSNNVSGSYTNNYIENNNTGISVVYQTGFTNNITVNYNYITGNTIGVAFTQSGMLINNFDCNWWSVVPQAAVADAIAAPVTYTTWLSTGTDSDPATVGFQPVSGACNQVLPVTFASPFVGTKQADANKLQWAVVDDNLLYFELQKSNNGVDFTKIATIYPTPANNYSYFDNMATNSLQDYYRLKIVERSGDLSYSNIVLLATVAGLHSIVKPSPFTNTVTILPSSQFKATINIAMYNNLGELVESKAITNFRSGDAIVLNKLGRLSAGIYNIILEDGVNKERTSIIK